MKPSARVLPFARPPKPPAKRPPAALTSRRTDRGLSLTLRIDALEVARELDKLEQARKP